MKHKIKKIFLKFNLSTIFFATVSLISITFAWFAFSNTISNNMEVSVKAWKINLTDNGEDVLEDFTINIGDFYPGVDSYNKSILIENDGDIDALVSYSINYLRIFDEIIDVSNQASAIDKLSQKFPFSFNFNTDSVVLPSGGSEYFNINISWPVDSADIYNDTYWGNKAYEFKNSNDNMSEIEVRISLNVSQYIGEDDNIDSLYIPGNSYMYNLITLDRCSTIGSGCYNFYVLDNNNKLRNSKVNLIGDVTSISNSLGSTYRLPTALELVSLISSDIYNSYIKIDGISNRIIGSVDYLDRVSELIEYVGSKNGMFVFDKESFSYLASDECYLTSTVYNDKVFVVKNISDKSIAIYLEDVSNNCKIIPVINVNK